MCSCAIKVRRIVKYWKQSAWSEKIKNTWEFKENIKINMFTFWANILIDVFSQQKKTLKFNVTLNDSNSGCSIKES